MDWGAGCFGSKHLIEEIYPQLCRPPEVMLDVGWDSKVDIWALGLLVSSFLRPVWFTLD